ncbi:hypothetical protein HELRODRAFT_178645 [Helobdella robusta]|uniref:Uncharacterized protein n=1 Tax=Helobdella robusta TaxID=6412 RepID=T1FDH8_HELRO|nr:hypothetical protein HELRODRAFT_178645 [Helobdella robusta]ESN96845.1 hypothetical protein HELRODRAFT_178645 [Helobdella robusta]
MWRFPFFFFFSSRTNFHWRETKSSKILSHSNSFARRSFVVCENDNISKTASEIKSNNNMNSNMKMVLRFERGCLFGFHKFSHLILKTDQNSTWEELLISEPVLLNYEKKWLFTFLLSCHMYPTITKLIAPTTISTTPSLTDETQSFGEFGFGMPVKKFREVPNLPYVFTVCV